MAVIITFQGNFYSIWLQDWGRPEKEQIQIGTLTYGVGIDNVECNAALLGQWLPEIERNVGNHLPSNAVSHPRRQKP